MHLAGASAFHLDPSQCHQNTVRPLSSPPAGHFFLLFGLFSVPDFDDTACIIRDLLRLSFFLSVFGVRCPAMVSQRLLSDFGQPSDVQLN